MSNIREDITKKILSITPSKPIGRYLLAPRFGKTGLVVKLIKREKPAKILWVTPSSKLAEVDIPKEFETWKAKKYIPKLTTSTWKSLHKVQGHFDMIILDEDQFITSNNVVNLLNGSLTYNSLIGMTGTDSDTYDKQWLYKVLGLETMYTMLVDEAVDNDILADYSITVIDVTMSTDNNIEAGREGSKFKTSELKNYQYLHRVCETAIFTGSSKVKFSILNRMRAVQNSPSKLAAAKKLMQNLEGRKLVFCANTAQADKLSSNTYHSKTDNSNRERFERGEIDELVMVNKGGVGDTYTNIDHLIIVQADSDKNGKTSQKISRTLLKQGDYKAKIWILRLLDTQDVHWVNSTLESFNPDKINIEKTNSLSIWK